MCCGSANCSGFFGDRTGAAREMVDGGPLDVLTGDWLAELTMYILHKTRERSGGYARTFLRELEEVLPTCIERGITVVSNAGGLQPEALAAAVGELARRQGLDVHVASVSGDDITPRLGDAAGGRGRSSSTSTPARSLPAGAAVVTANAYLRARPIADALAAGAQVVVTGRVTDAALVVGPALHAFGWSDGDLDAIAGAVVAGHVIECGAQCCGGNYAFFEEVPGRERIGFPLAELHADGSSVITKHPGTGGMVTVGTVTAQLLYEIGGPRYLSPDAVARFDTHRARPRRGPTGCASRAVRGEAPPATLKVTANLDAGWRNAMTLALTGAQVAEKARFAAEAVWAGVPGGRAGFAETAEDLSGDLTGGGMAYLRLAVRGDDEQAVGRAFSGAVVETSLSSYPGTFFTSAPSGAQGVARYWPTTVSAAAVTPHIECDGRPVPATPLTASTPVSPRRHRPSSTATAAGDAEPDAAAGGGHGRGPAVGARRRPLGRQGRGRQRGRLGRRRRRGGLAPARVLRRRCSRRCCPRSRPFPVSRYPLPNLRAVNFVVHGILGWGVASNLRLDTQAKGLGELLRSRPVEVPAALVASGPAAARLAATLTARPGRPVAGASGRMAPWSRSPAWSRSSRASPSSSLTAWSVFTALVVPRVTSSPAMRMLARVARRLGPAARPEAPELRGAGPGALVRRPRGHGAPLRDLALPHRPRLRADHLSGTPPESTSPRRSASQGRRCSRSASSRRATPGPRASRSLPPASALLVVALEIAYLPALYNQFSTRETEVTLLEARAGNPAWGPEILARHHWLDTMDELPPLYSDWERWAAAVSESHANYPGLIWFRSPVSTRSWLVGLVAMMDSAALYHSVSPAQTPRQARLCLSMGINCLRSMARALRIPYDDDPLPTAGIRLSAAGVRRRVPPARVGQLPRRARRRTTPGGTSRAGGSTTSRSSTR